MGILSSLFGIGGSKPSTSTVVQQQNIPKELAPFIKEILGEAQTLYKADIERGYDPYTGLTTAPFTPEQEAAQEGISGLVGTTAPFLAEAFDIYQEGGEKFTPEVAQEYMSPYQRAVTDIEKREAQRQFERTALPAFEKRAVDAGGMSGLGTRAGVEAAEMQRGQSQLLADIEAKGLQSAFRDAQQQFAQQKAREQQMAGNIGRTGPALFQAGLAERGAQMGVGEQKREAAQSELDEAYFKFLEERGFPQQTLTDYSQMVYGSPLSKQPFPTTTTTTGTPFVSSPASQLMGLGLGGLNIYGMAGGWSPGGPSMQNLYSGGRNPLAKEGGQVIPREGGGQVNPRGLSGLPVIRRQASGRSWHTPLIPGSDQSQLGAAQNVIGDVLGPLAAKAVSNIRMLPPRTRLDMKRKLGLAYNPAHQSKLHESLSTGRLGEHFIASGLRENRLAKARADRLAKRGTYFPEAIKETEVIDIGGGVGKFLKDQAAGKHKEGMTPIDILAGALSAGAETAGEQKAEGRKERAKLKKDQYTEEITDIETEKGEDIAALDKESQVRLEEITNNFNKLTALSKLSAEEATAVQNMMKGEFELDKLLLYPAEVLTKLMTSIAASKGQKLPSFTSQSKMIRQVAADRAGVMLKEVPPGSGTFEISQIGGGFLSTDSDAYKTYNRMVLEGLSKFYGDYMKNPSQIGMAKSLKSFVDKYKVPQTATRKFTAHANQPAGLPSGLQLTNLAAVSSAPTGFKTTPVTVSGVTGFFFISNDGKWLVPKQ